MLEFSYARYCLRPTRRLAKVLVSNLIDFQCIFIQMIILKYWNPNYQIGLADWRVVYQFPQAELMIKEMHQGRLYYRLSGSTRRISYNQLKRGLKKKQIIIEEEPNLLPF